METKANKTTIELFTDLLRELVGHRDLLRVEEKTAGSTVTLILRVHAADYPKVIGHGGGNIKGLKALLTAIGRRESRKYFVVLPEPTFGKEEPLTPFRADPAWDRTEEIGDLLRDVLGRLSDAHEVEVSDVDDTTIYSVEVRGIDGSATELDGHMSKLFQAVGKANGRNIFLSLVERFRDEPEKSV